MICLQMNIVKKLLLKSIIRKCSKDLNPYKTVSIVPGVIGSECIVVLCGIYSLARTKKYL